MSQSVLAFIYVGLGGCLGALLRYLTSLATQTWSFSFPLGTLAANLAGCFLIGIVVTLAAEAEVLSPEVRLFLATGVCGGFTTLSSMIYEFAELLRDDELLLAGLYFSLTFIGALVFFYLGSLLVNFLFKP